MTGSSVSTRTSRGSNPPYRDIALPERLSLLLALGEPWRGLGPRRTGRCHLAALGRQSCRPLPRLLLA